MNQAAAQVWSRHMSTHAINSLVPSLVPAPLDSGNYESTDLTIKYYREKGVKSLIITPYILGIHCDIYVSRTSDNTYCEYKIILENGTILTHDDIVYHAVNSIERILSQIDWNVIDTVIYRGFLGPLGIFNQNPVSRKSLVYFNQPDYSMFYTSGFRCTVDTCSNIKQLQSYQEFIKNVNIARTSFNYELFRRIANLNTIVSRSIDMDISDIKSDIENSDFDKIYFVPYTRIKEVCKGHDHEYLPYNNELVYQELHNNEGWLSIDLDDDNCVDKVNKFLYDYCSNLPFSHGVLIRPIKAGTLSHSVIPAIICRQPRLCELIYNDMGSHDNESTFSTAESKSLKQQELNDKLEAIPYNLLHVSREVIEEALQEC